MGLIWVIFIVYGKYAGLHQTFVLLNISRHTLNTRCLKKFVLLKVFQHTLSEM